MDVYDQKELINELKVGDRDSYEFLYKHYGKKIYNLVFKMIGNQAEAEDILQDVMLQIYQNINKFRMESDISTWIYSITKNLCLKYLQNKKKSSFQNLEYLIDSASKVEGIKSYSDFEKRHYIDQVKEGCLLGLLRCLSFYQRIAFIFIVILEVEVKDVAQIVCKSESAIRTLVFRAKQNLRKFLCKNCSLYNYDNPCRCENLINFSLKQGWIQEVSQTSQETNSIYISKKIEREISKVNKIIYLYTTLPDRQLPPEIAHKLQSVIIKQGFDIFSRKKVK